MREREKVIRLVWITRTWGRVVDENKLISLGTVDVAWTQALIIMNRSFDNDAFLLSMSVYGDACN